MNLTKEDKKELKTLVVRTKKFAHLTEDLRAKHKNLCEKLVKIKQEKQEISGSGDGDETKRIIDEKLKKFDEERKILEVKLNEAEKEIREIENGLNRLKEKQDNEN